MLITNKSERKIKILLTDGTNKNCLAAVKSLHKAGYEIGVISKSTKGHAILSKFVNFRIVASEKNFLKAIKYSLKTFRPNIIIPVGDNSVRAIHENRDMINNISVPISSEESLNTATNKFASTKFMYDHDIPVPEYVIVSKNEFSMKEAIKKFGLPLVLKGPYGTASSQVRICKNELEVINFAQELFNLNDQIMVQKYIKGEGTGYFALFCQGNELAFFMHKRIREYPVRGGPSVCAKSIYQKDLRDLGKECLTLLKWHGVGMIEFKRETKTNKLWFIEINPKFWGSLELSIKSGVDFPALLVNMAMNNSICDSEFKVKYILDYQFQWLFPGEIQHFLETRNILQTIKGILFYNFRYSGNDFSLRDPYPSVLGLYLSMRAIGRAILKRNKT